MENTNNWLNSYTNNVLLPVPSPPAGPSASTSSSSGDSPMASTSATSASQDEQTTKAAVKDKKRRACDACRIRRIRCQRMDARSESCDSCVKMNIRCVESKPKARTSQKGARIAQAKLLYGDASDSNALTVVMRNTKAFQEQTRPRTPSATEVLMIAAIDASFLLAELVPAVAKLKVARFPLLRWIEIENEFKNADGRLSNFDGESQALFLALAALGSRSSHSEAVVGKNAPTLSDLSRNPALRSGLGLCEYGRRRERVASELLQVAYRKLNENQLFATPSLRNVAALATVEMLILVYHDNLAFTRAAARKARPLSAAVASHLRIIAEDCNGDPKAPFGYYSVAWTSVIRDALVSSVTGRALDFTENDLFIVLKIDVNEPLHVPTAEELFDGCMKHALEGPALMRLWSAIIRIVRRFVTDVTQPLAVARPRLKLEVFDDFYTLLKQARDAFGAALVMLAAANRNPPDQKRVLQYCSDFMLAQAHRIILWRCSEEQLTRARTAPSSLTGIQEDNFETYKTKLQALRVRSTEEAFQAARRIMKDITQTFKPDDIGNAEFFVPGYFIYDGLLVWTSLIVDTKTLEDGGRIDYSLADKLADLEALREAIAITGWSGGTVQPHLEQLGKIISSFELHQRTIAAPPSPAFFSEYINMSPPPQTPKYQWPSPQPPFSADPCAAPPMESYSTYPYQSSVFTEIEDQRGVAEFPQMPTATASQPLTNEVFSGFQVESNGNQYAGFENMADQLPSSEYLEQFLNSVNFQLYQ